MKNAGVLSEAALGTGRAESKRQVEVLAVRKQTLVEPADTEERRAGERRSASTRPKRRRERLVEPRHRLVVQVVVWPEASVYLDAGAFD
jgi:hypothetical protein